MLLELNVKDIALVRKASVSFGEGINILTGETGTGKSVIIDSAMLALGAKAHGDIIRQGAEYAYVELVFDVDEAHKAKLSEAGIETDENGLLIVSRRIMPGRSISRINDETVTAAALKKTASLLLNVYGQNEYYTLMDRKQHLNILDEYAQDAAAGLISRTAEAYAVFKKAEVSAAGFDLDEKERARRTDLLSFELNEIDEAALTRGEEELLAQRYKKLNNARSILEHVSTACGILTACDTGRAVSELEYSLRYDEELKGDLNAYADTLEVDEEAIAETESRLDLIRRLELKYGADIDEILAYRERISKELSDMDDYDRCKAEAERELEEASKQLQDCCGKLSALRKEFSVKLCRAVENELKDLGFEKPHFEMEFKLKKPSADGCDDVCFMAALNPGEKPKALGDVASGGELSRVMLAIKTILAETDDMPTLIFDEIDTGISGRTAQKVAEKLDVIGMRHQVICVSHLPQIAAMADTHFVIKKTETDGRNITNIEKLDDKGSEAELARLLGGAEITKAVSENAAELLKLARVGKKKRRKA